MKLNKRIGFVLIAVAILVFSCEKESTPTFALLTETPLYVSGESARLVGRLIANEQLLVEDHGFWVATEEGFSDPIVVSLGTRNVPGRFVGEIRSLEPDRLYFAKAFTEIGGKISFGNFIQLNSLNPGIFLFPLNMPCRVKPSKF
jgi:hypothetical protein